MISRRFKVAVQLALVVIILLYLNRTIVGPTTEALRKTETEIKTEQKQLQVQEPAVPTALFPGQLTTSNEPQRELQNPQFIQQPHQNLKTKNFMPLRDEEKLETIKKVYH